MKPRKAKHMKGAPCEVGALLRVKDPAVVSGWWWYHEAGEVKHRRIPDTVDTTLFVLAIEVKWPYSCLATVQRISDIEPGVWKLSVPRSEFWEGLEPL